MKFHHTPGQATIKSPFIQPTLVQSIVGVFCVLFFHLATQATRRWFRRLKVREKGFAQMKESNGNLGLSAPERIKVENYVRQLCATVASFHTGTELLNCHISSIPLQAQSSFFFPQAKAFKESFGALGGSRMDLQVPDKANCQTFAPTHHHIMQLVS